MPGTIDPPAGPDEKPETTKPAAQQPDADTDSASPSNSDSEPKREPRDTRTMASNLYSFLRRTAR